MLAAVRVVFCLLMVLIAGCAAESGDHFDHDEREEHDLGVVSEALSTLSCSMSTATG
ncbi:MAG: hypothetical protein IT377_32720, partial [Polyangiaceae bacterium]|nr:hypothetical protein [Polyangiaceae bacterium]